MASYVWFGIYFIVCNVVFVGAYILFVFGCSRWVECVFERVVVVVVGCVVACIVYLVVVAPFVLVTTIGESSLVVRFFVEYI